MKKIILALFLGGLIFVGCKKTKKDDTTPAPTGGDTTIPTTGTALDLMRDSMYLYAKEDYYWSDALPDYSNFAPRSYTGTDDLTTLKAELYAITQYKMNPSTSKAYENTTTAGRPKYSYIDAGESSTKLSAVTGDFGFVPTYFNTVDNLVVRLVYPGSPAGLAGIKRGYKIIKINDRTSYDYDGAGGANTAFVSNAYANSSTISMTLKRPDGTTFDVNLNATTYKVQAVFTTNIVDEGGGKKMGYIYFSDFVSLASTQTALDEAFATFAAAGVTDLTVDLRYNGGGYVQTSEYLANLIAPTSVASSLMYTKYYNPLLTSNKSTLLKNQPRRTSSGQLYTYADLDYSVGANRVYFAKKGALKVSRVFFIVTASTASASELTINNLRPYMNVQLIGNTTYGKPVGFFDIKINKYSMYIPEFETKNGQEKGGYFSGMTPASTDYPGYLTTGDDLSKDFGDPTEGLFAKAINYSKNGTYGSAALQVQSTGGNLKTLSAADVSDFNHIIEGNKFNGMLIERP